MLQETGKNFYLIYRLFIYEINNTLNKSCEIPPNPCLSQPCLNNGICSRVSDFVYSCTCINGYSGTRCEQAPSNILKIVFF
jgi:protein crumbs